jgi:hypothetical protein
MCLKQIDAKLFYLLAQTPHFMKVGKNPMTKARILNTNNVIGHCKNILAERNIQLMTALTSIPQKMAQVCCTPKLLNATCSGKNFLRLLPPQNITKKWLH